MYRYNADLNAIDEIWLRDREEGRAPAVPGYRFRHIPLNSATKRFRGGGVGYNMRNNIMSFSILTHPEAALLDQT